jgi:3-hydroxyacyl-CoA dehydrogenase/enoyl-CoA hydratase/3-hydroxybutyryl-CoA epimerase
VISTFLNEGVAMLAEGIDPQTIEQACAQAGYPAPVLQLMDELTLTLPRKIRDEARAAAGDAYVPHPAEAVLDRMVEEFDRRAAARGRVLRVRERAPHAPVARLRSELGATNHDVDLHELAERMLVVEAVETQRCLDEGVLTSVADANVGSVLGIGYPPWTGGVVQYVEGFPGGVAAVVARADALADRYGERFRVPACCATAPRPGMTA